MLAGNGRPLRRLVMIHLQWGKLSTALTYAEQAITLAPPAPDTWSLASAVEALFRNHLAILYTLQGEAEAAARELAELDSLYPTPGHATTPLCPGLATL